MSEELGTRPKEKNYTIEEVKLLRDSFRLMHETFCIFHDAYEMASLVCSNCRKNDCKNCNDAASDLLLHEEMIRSHSDLKRSIINNTVVRSLPTVVSKAEA